MTALKRSEQRIIAIDPGTTHSGWCLFVGGRVDRSGVIENDEVLAMFEVLYADVLAVEMIASYGMAVGKEVFETCVWIGRFVQAWRTSVGSPVRLVYRRDVKLHLCGNARAKDANIRQALIDLYGGKAEAIGDKKRPGPLYGVKSHAWSALAVAVTTGAGHGPN